MLGDLHYIFIWWVVLLLIGSIFLPLTILIFNSFFDKGYAFSKVIGIIIISFSIWILASFHILNFSQLNLYLIIFFAIILNAYLLIKKNLLKTILGNLKIFIAEELIFALGFIFWAFIRGFQPDIHGLEKYMDFGFVNSILRSDFFPPKDIWLTPNTINYYYFGHLVTATLIKITNIDSIYGFNLMLALIFGLTLATSFSVSANIYYFYENNIKKIFLSGILGSLLTTISGNMQTIYAFFAPYNAEKPVPFWELSFVNNFTTYFYPNATRFIPNTIHEFPMYTTTVADLHGHLLNTPFGILTIAFLILLFLNKNNLLIKILIGFMIAISFMTNFLDGLVYIMFTTLIICFKNFKTIKLVATIYLLLKSLTIIIISSIIFSLPFWLNFKPFGSGIGIICSPNFLIKFSSIGPFIFETDRCTRTSFWMFFILYGLFIFVFTKFFITIFSKYRTLKKISNIDCLVIVFFTFAFISILLPELIYFKDIYTGHFRSNTMFKFSYSAFIASSIVSGFIIVRTFPSLKNYLQSLYIAALFLLLYFAFLFPYFSIKTYYNNLSSYKGLDGIKYLSTLYPSDYEAISWIRKNIKGQPVILEANGESYTDFARVSANTGLITVIGWPVHEWLWRGSYDVASPRITDVQTLYETTNLDISKQLVKKYNINLVFIGILEKQKYPNLFEDKFKTLGYEIYRNNQTVIYKLTSNN